MGVFSGATVTHEEFYQPQTPLHTMVGSVHGSQKADALYPPLCIVG